MPITSVSTDPTSRREVNRRSVYLCTCVCEFLCSCIFFKWRGLIPQPICTKFDPAHRLIFHFMSSVRPSCEEGCLLSSQQHNGWVSTGSFLCTCRVQHRLPDMWTLISHNTPPDATCMHLDQRTYIHVTRFCASVCGSRAGVGVDITRPKMVRTKPDLHVNSSFK